MLCKYKSNMITIFTMYRQTPEGTSWWENCFHNSFQSSNQNLKLEFSCLCHKIMNIPATSMFLNADI